MVGHLSDNTSLDEDSDLPMPMLIDQFEIVASKVRFEKAQLRDACKAVLVDGIGTVDAAQRYGLSKVVVSRKNGQLLERWKKLCDETGLVNITLAVPQEFAGLLITAQRYVLDNLKRQNVGEADED